MDFNSTMVSEIDAYMMDLMADWQVHGTALAVIRDGEVVLSKGYGYRDFSKKLPVDPQTLFPIGSASKAFTATALGILVDRGVLEWDMPVKDLLPDFDLFDPFAAANITPRDLLCHRSGLGGHNMPWFGSICSRAELVERMAYLEPNLGFRTGFQYQNLMFVAAGFLVEKLSGLCWEDFVIKEIFHPLGMNSSNFSVELLKTSPNVSLPYRVEDGIIREIPYANLDIVGPAGSINSNLEDMIQWVQLQLSEGEANGHKIISPEVLNEIHTPQMLIKGGFFGPLGEYPDMFMDKYALGWFVQNYRGQTLIHHGGHIDGFAALISFCPKEKSGVIFLSNDNRTFFVIPPSFYMYDRLFNLEPEPWSERIFSILKTTGTEEEKARKALLTKRKEGTHPSLSLEAYEGAYHNPGYGPLTVEENAEGLLLNFNGQKIYLKHFHFDVFECVYEEEGKNIWALVRFVLDKLGQVNAVEIPFEPSVKDIVFKKL